MKSESATSESKALESAESGDDPNRSPNGSNERDSADVPRMPSGSRYAGQEIDITSRRSVRILCDEAKQSLIDAHNSHVVVQDFYHDGKFWNARIPLGAIKSVFGQSFNFSAIRTRKGAEGREVIRDRNGWPKRKIPIAYHVQSRFQMAADHPVQLYEPNADLKGDAGCTITDFVYSVEAIGPVGWEFNIKTGLGGHLISAHRFMSMTEMVFERIVVESQYVFESPPLPLSAEEMRDLLTCSITRSHRAGLTEKYYLYRVCGTNNCTSNPFQILDSVVHYRWPHNLGAMLYRLPLRPRFYLKVRGLDPEPGVFNLVKDEFQEFVDDPVTRQRKRDFVRAAIRRKRQAETKEEQDKS